jgi:hypothetical protein
MHIVINQLFILTSGNILERTAIGLIPFLGQYQAKYYKNKCIAYAISKYPVFLRVFIEQNQLIPYKNVGNTFKC